MYLEIEGVSTHYQRQGKGAPFLLVHGWGGSMDSFEALYQQVSRQFDSIILDLPGFGQSGQPGPHWGIPEYAHFLKQFLTACGVEKVIFFGHSFGGSLGLYLAAHSPVTVDKLIVAGASFKRRKTTSPAFLTVKKILTKVPFYTLLRRRFLMTFYRLFFLQSDISKFPKLEANFRQIVSFDLSAYLPRIKQPTLILWGKKDIYTPQEDAHEAKKLIKGARLKIFADCGHNLPLVKPDLVYREIADFIKSNK